MSEDQDLPHLLRSLDPQLDPARYVFCSVDQHALHMISATTPLATFQESEGLSLVLKKEQAIQHGLQTGPEFNLITLGVQSSLVTVGLTAAVASCLAENGISANVIAAYYHDHILVPADRANDALEALKSLGEA